jgi:hypothetical protein
VKQAAFNVTNAGLPAYSVFEEGVVGSPALWHTYCTKGLMLESELESLRCISAGLVIVDLWSCGV